MAVRFNNTWAMMLACCFNVSVIQATEFEYETSLVYAKYENINHVREPEEDENSRSILAEFSLIENRADLQADINVELEIIDYYRDLASDRADENIDVEAIWLLSPGRFPGIYLMCIDK